MSMSLFGKKTAPQVDTPKTVDQHFTDLKDAVYRAASIAEDAGVPLALIRNFFGGCHNNYITRAEVAIDAANARSQIPSEAVARAEHVRRDRAERALQAEREAYRDAVGRAADAEDARRGR
jgi:hypothetical protein